MNELTNLLESLIKLRNHYVSIMPTSFLINQIDKEIEITFNKIKQLNK